MPTHFTKGTEVFAVRNWDHFGTIGIQRMTIQACGKKIVKATFTKTGEFINQSFYQHNINTDYDAYCSVWMFDASVNIEEEAMKLGALFIEYEKKRALLSKLHLISETPVLKFL